MTTVEAMIDNLYGGRLAIRVERIARALDVSRSLIHKEIDAGRFPCVKVGRCKLVPKHELMGLLTGEGKASDGGLGSTDDWLVAVLGEI
jgi:hypothetical protein